MPGKQQLWGTETAKAVQNFPISGETMPLAVIHWLARVKGAAATVNCELGLLDRRRAARIRRAAAEIAAGEHDDQFPIDVFQTGSGTSTNMNVNEVIAAQSGASASRAQCPQSALHAGSFPAAGGVAGRSPTAPR